MTRTSDELTNIASFADALPAAIWVGRAPSGECVYVNREFEKILGITPPTDATRGNYVGPYGVHLPDGKPYPEDQMPFERVMRARGPIVVDDLVIHRHDGERTWLRVSATPMFAADGSISHVVEAFTDITREVKSEQARRDGERQLQMVQRLESIGSLAGGIAHDFNNLLAIVKLVAAQLGKNETDPVRQELVRALSEVSDSAAKLTRSLLGFARRGRNVVERVNVNELAGSVADLASRTFEKRITVRTDLSAAPGAVDGDSTQLEQLLMNLIMNARDAISGEGEVFVKTRPVTFGAGEHPLLGAGRYLVLEVSDTGAGIDPSVADRVFEPYVTTKTSAAKKGTGLGLATVFGIAKSHGGHAEVASTGPGGTTMRATLPISASGDALPAAKPSPLVSGGLVRGSGTVLVVDDEPLIRRTTAMTLEALGYRVVVADSGAKALEVMRDYNPDVRGVVLDMTMPGLSTRETFTQLRRLRPSLPVIVMSGSATSDTLSELTELGVAGVLPKPFDEGQLSRMLASALGIGV